MNRIWIILLSTILIFLGCATTKKTSEPTEQVKEEPEIKMIEDLDPMTLTDDDFVIEPKIKDEVPKKTYTNAKTEALISIGSDSADVKIINVQGYRVQIGSFTNIDDANEIKREAMLSFEDVNVYSIFDPPYYKIRVGDFEDRREAESLQEKAVSRGFKDAWIVRTLVEKKVLK